MTLLIRLLLVSFTLFSSSAGADYDAALNLLQGYEWQLPEDKLDELGPDIYESFLRIARDENQLNFIRARAVTTLGQFQNDEVWSFFKSGLVADGGLVRQQSNVQRRQLVEGICSSFVASKTDEVREILIPLLSESDAHVRTKSANCLQRIDSPEVENALTKYRSTILEPWEMRAAGFSMEIQ